MKILTATQMQRIDRLTTERYGVPSLTLMENAGRNVVEFMAQHFAPLARHKITVICGKGNNGGDGMVVARMLRERGCDPRVILLALPGALKGDAAVNCERLAASSTLETAESPEAWDRVRPSLAGTTLVVDAILGTGLSKPLEGFLLQVVRDLNRDLAAAKVVAVDLPSGISADTGELMGEFVRADASVTFTAPKVAHVFPPAGQQVGKWEVRPIGTPPEALAGDPELNLNLTTRQDLAWLLEPRRADANKGNFGHVLILAGSVGKTGAAAMAAKSALRSGAGLVTVATAASVLPVVAGLGMEFMTEPLPETEAGTISLRALDQGPLSRLDRLIQGKTVLAVGPGIGAAPETAELVRAVLQRYDLPIVLDADGLNAFAGRASMLRSGGRTRVLTPHPGEMARLTGETTADIQAHRLEAARSFATTHQLHLILKGYRTLAAGPDGEIWVNPTGNPGMATGGTGDVLTGLVAGLLAQHPQRSVTEVAAAAVYLHGLAGDLAAQEFGEVGMIAGDLVNALPRAFKSLADAAA
ncbi:MAG TPA: NAD(P)H-hydrate dehydratase [Terriglobia bacterium]|nr:NAD(P)H-hydrate dehydratase [Terriglobia bacterium]